MAKGKDSRHIYCIMEAKQGEKLEPIKIGENGENILAIRHRDIAAVSGNTLIGERDLHAKDVLVRCLLSHQTVIEGIMKKHTVIPVKFPTIVKSAQEVEQILEQGYGVLRNALNFMSNRIEINVAASWDKGSVFQDIYNQNEDIRRLQQKIAGQSTPQPETDKIELGKMIRSVLLERREKYGAEIMDSLGKHALALCYHELFDDMMIINSSLLMRKDQEEEFDWAVNELDKKYQQKMNFRCIGPLPAYSFSTVEIRKIDSNQVNEAKELLGLGDEPTMSEIRKAYRRLAHESHPDKHPNELQAPMNFKRITEAYELLQDYCQSGRYSFKDRDIEDFTLIKVLRNGEMN